MCFLSLFILRVGLRAGGFSVFNCAVFYVGWLLKLCSVYYLNYKLFFKQRFFLGGWCGVWGGFVCLFWLVCVFFFSPHDGLWLFYIIGTFALSNGLDYFCLLK